MPVFGLVLDSDCQDKMHPVTHRPICKNDPDFSRKTIYI